MAGWLISTSSQFHFRFPVLVLVCVLRRQKGLWRLWWRSTQDAVSCLTHAINAHLDKRCEAFKAVFLDFSNAFNTLPRQGLLDKFAATTPPHWLMKLIHNYLTGRSQYIRVNNKTSSAIPSNCGVLQGAVLSPFFFTLHTSDLFSESLVYFLKYTDDVVIGHPCRDAQGLSIFNNALKYVSE